MPSFQPLDDVRWGVIGAGDVFETKSGPPLYQVDGSSLVAVMSRREAKAQAAAERHGADRFYTAADALIADDAVNAVYIATPPNVHAELTRKAAEAGKHVLCEKPMAMTVAECRQMVDACAANDVQLMIAYYRRFFPVVQKMKALVDGGAIGEVLRAHAACGFYWEPRADGERGWLVEPDVAGGGFLTDVATHRLDLFHFLLGEPTHVAAFVDTQTQDVDVDDASVLVLQFEGGRQATGAFNWNVGVGIDEFEVVGTGGRLVSRNLGAGKLALVTSAGEETFTLPAPEYPHHHLVEHFVECLRTGEPNALPGEAGMQATRMTEAAYASARSGRVEAAP